MLDLPIKTTQLQGQSWVERAEMLGQQLAKHSTEADENDRFVAENFAALKQAGLMSAGVPSDLSGGGASYRDMCAVLGKLAEYCSSTALAFSMHTHQVMTAVWKRQHQNAPVDDLLRRVAKEQIVILTSGGSDWLEGSGTATKVAGGYQISATKVFASGAPAGDLLMTGAVYDDPEQGSSVLHFAIPMQAEGVTIDPVWRAMGMRGTGSHNILLSDVFVPDAAIKLQRPQGKWHPAFHLISMIALPLIYSVYVGVAKAARDRAVQHLQKRPANGHTSYLVGGIDNELTAAQLALNHIITVAESSQPGFETTNQIMIGRTLVARAVVNVADQVMEAVGGSAFFRSKGIERLFRDAQAARYHPMREGDQQRLTGQLALGWPVDAT